MKIQILTVILVAQVCGFSAYALDLIDVPTSKGKIKALANGMSIYVFDMDAPPASHCVDACAEKWPPVLLTADEIASNLISPLGKTTRPNGLVQLTYQGRPVYTFFADRLPADIKGDGLGRVWHLINTQGF
jgi:predicted lipoprotein with Yx(FWY)xxD motif